MRKFKISFPLLCFAMLPTQQKRARFFGLSWEFPYSIDLQICTGRARITKLSISLAAGRRSLRLATSPHASRARASLRWLETVASGFPPLFKVPHRPVSFTAFPHTQAVVNLLRHTWLASQSCLSFIVMMLSFSALETGQRKQHGRRANYH